jgi:uncharacterized membrane protein
MTLASIGATNYNVLLAVHILAAVAAFGPAMAYTVLNRKAASRPGETGAALASIAPLLNKRTTLPALVVAAIAGVGLVVQSDDAWTFEQGWVSAAFTIVLVLALLCWFVIAPMLKRFESVASKPEATQDELRAARVPAAVATGIFHLGMVVLIVLMIWKPGA